MLILRAAFAAAHAATLAVTYRHRSTPPFGPGARGARPVPYRVVVLVDQLCEKSNIHPCVLEILEALCLRGLPWGMRRKPPPHWDYAAYAAYLYEH